MSKITMTALKPMRYNTRRLVAGDTFEARVTDSKVLIALKRASLGRAEGNIPEIPADLVTKIKSSSVESLYGSSVLDATYEIGGETVQLGTIVANAHKLSGLTVSEWNMLGTGERDVLLNTELNRLQMEAEASSSEDEDDEGEGEGEGEEEEPPAGPTGATGTVGTSGSVLPATVPVVEQAPVTTPAPAPEVDALGEARARYKAVLGRAAYGAWDVAKIEEKIAEFEAAQKGK
jgi:hypothetical protein